MSSGLPSYDEPIWSPAWHAVYDVHPGQKLHEVPKRRKLEQGPCDARLWEMALWVFWLQGIFWGSDSAFHMQLLHRNVAPNAAQTAVDLWDALVAMPHSA